VIFILKEGQVSKCQESLTTHNANQEVKYVSGFPNLACMAMVRIQALSYKKLIMHHFYVFKK
jgi:hypothetical protein